MLGTSQRISFTRNTWRCRQRNVTEETVGFEFSFEYLGPFGDPNPAVVLTGFDSREIKIA